MKYKKYKNNWQELSSYETYSQQSEKAIINNYNVSVQALQSNSNKRDMGNSADTHTLTGLERFIKKYGEHWNGK